MALLLKRHFFAISLLVSSSLWAEQPTKKEEAPLPKELEKKVKVTGTSLSEEEIFLFQRILKATAHYNAYAFTAKVSEKDVRIRIETAETLESKGRFFAKASLNIELPVDETTPAHIKIRCSKQEGDKKIVCKARINREVFKESAETAKKQYEADMAAAKKAFRAAFDEQFNG